MQNFKPLHSFCGFAVRFESTLVANPEDRFSRDEAHLNYHQLCLSEHVHDSYRKNPEYSDIQKFAVITLKYEQNGFTEE